MKFKFYENAWIPGIKGVFYLIFGLFAFIKGSTLETTSIFFDVLIILIAIIYLAIGFLTRGIKNRIWIIIAGMIHLGFGVWLTINWGNESVHLLWIVTLWILYSALTDLVEALILYAGKNVLGTLFIVNMLVTLVFAYFTMLLHQNYTPETLHYQGIIAILAGLITECSGFVISQSRFLAD